TPARLVDEKLRTATGSVVDCTSDRELARLLELAILCNDVELLDAKASDANGSATEIALVRAAIRVGLDVEAVRARQPRRATLERAEDRRYMVTVHHADRRPTGDGSGGCRRAGAFERQPGGDCRGRPARGIRGGDRQWRSASRIRPGRPGAEAAIGTKASAQRAGRRNDRRRRQRYAAAARSGYRHRPRT